MTITRPAAQRFWPQVTKTDTCWIWDGARQPEGYGRFLGDHGRAVLVHRWSYEHHVGPISDALTVDHLCRNTSCVNPAHMELVSREENARRGNPNTDKPECIYGHAFDDINTYWTSRGNRDCRACRQRRQAEGYQRRKAKRAAARAAAQEAAA